jgi:hypothetical protein
MERKLLNTLCWIAVMSITAFTSPFSHANEASMEQIKRLVADAFRYPADKLKITPNEAPNGRASFGVESVDGTFFPITLDVGKRGNVLKPQFEAQLSAMLAKATTEQKERKNGLRRVQLRGQGYAYLGIGAGGPGGSQSTAVFVFPKSESEVAITVTASREDSLNIEGAPKEYQALMSENSPDMVGRITQLAEQVVALTEAPTGMQKTKSSTASQSGSPDIKQSQPPAAKQAPEAKPAPIPSEEPTSSTPWSIIVVLVVAAIGLLWLLVKNRK